MTVPPNPPPYEYILTGSVIEIEQKLKNGWEPVPNVFPMGNRVFLRRKKRS